MGSAPSIAGGSRVGDIVHPRIRAAGDCSNRRFESTNSGASLGSHLSAPSGLIPPGMGPRTPPDSDEDEEAGEKEEKQINVNIPPTPKPNIVIHVLQSQVMGMRIVL